MGEDLGLGAWRSSELGKEGISGTRKPTEVRKHKTLMGGSRQGWRMEERPLTPPPCQVCPSPHSARWGLALGPFLRPSPLPLWSQGSDNPSLGLISPEQVVILE